MSELIISEDQGRTEVLHPMVQMAMQSNNFSPDSLDKLLSVQRDWEAGEAKKAFNAAFTQMQTEIPVIPKTKDGHNCKFTPLEVSVGTLRPIMDRHGFSFRHSVSQNGSEVTVTCILAHAQGHSESSTMTANPDSSGSKNAIQAIGSTRTYLKRYTFEDVVGIATGDYDDDAVGASPEPQLITESQEADIFALLSEKKMSKDRLISWLEKQDPQITRIGLIPSALYARVIKTIEAAQ